MFTGILSPKEPGEYTYLRMSDGPLVSGCHTLDRGRPPYGGLGREISYADLPEDCKGLILEIYRKMWDL